MLKKDFAQAVKRAESMSSNAFLDAILEERPDLREKVKSGAVKPVFPGQGFSAYTVIVGDEVFKTSQGYAWPGIETKDLILGIEREHDLLQYLQDSELPMPKLTYTGRKLSFFGMTRLQGETLNRWDVDGLAPDDKRQLAKDIATFCADLANAVPADDAVKMNLDASPAEVMFDAKQLRADMDSARARKLFGERYDFFKKAVDDYIDYREKNPATAEKVLMHCDLKDGNMLWNPETKRLTGVIDFGLSHLTSVESGFKKLYEKFPADFTDMVLEEYAALQSIKITRQQVQTWACAEYVAYALNVQKSTDYGRSYNNYVKWPLQLKYTPPAQAPAATQTNIGATPANSASRFWIARLFG